LRYGHAAQLSEAVNGRKQGNRSQRRAVSVQRSAFSGTSQHDRLMRLDFPFEKRRAGRFHGSHVKHLEFNNAQIN